MNEIKKQRYDLIGPRVAEEMKKRHFEACYCSTAAEAVDKVLAMIPAEDVVSWGGSVTLDELGIKAMLRQRNQPIVDRDSVPAEQRMAAMRRALTCDTFLMSANAVTEDGQLVNLDGNGNRLSALLFGPKSVIVIAGMNKLTSDAESAVKRVRHTAAAENGVRIGGNTPCAKTGECADCLSPDCICSQLVITRLSRPAGKIKVVLVGEELGL